LPWALYYLIRLLREGGQRSAIGFGVTFRLNALCSWHLGIKLALFGALVLAAYWFRCGRPRGEMVRDLALSAVTAVLIVAPFVAPLIVEIASGADYFQKPA